LQNASNQLNFNVKLSRCFPKGIVQSSINVSLTYLRGLEVPEHAEEDMPEL